MRLRDLDMYVEITGAGAPLVLLHGYTGCGGDWNYVFASRPPDFKCIVPDLRGHGRSTNPSDTFTFRQAALDIYALLDTLGVDRFNAIGVSAGAKTLLHMATQQPARLDSLVLVSATPYFPTPARMLMARMTEDNQSEEDWKVMRARHKHGDDQIRALWRHGNAFKDSYDDVNFTAADLGTIRARTLIVHGDRDPLYPVQLAFELHASIPRSYLWVVPNGGHGPIFGTFAARFVETALAFLRRGLDEA